MSGFDDAMKKLNKEQRLAVETIEGPVLIVAGPGTGKTQVLSLRIANILKSTDVNPSNILCLTFTESGVNAMRKRLFEMIGTPAYYVKIHTFHSFCNEIILSFPEKFAFARELSQLDDLNKLKMIQEVIENLNPDEKMELRPFHNKFFYKSQILSSIETLKREGVDYLKFEDMAKSTLSNLEANPILNKRKTPSSDWKRDIKNAKKNIELSKFYSSYQEKLKENGFYDYEDMLLFVIEKFKVDEELLAYYQEKFLYILVDEYQDTNGAQNEILKYLGSFDRSPNIFAVGDDDQAVYRFQGANLENLLFFERQFQNVKTIPIKTNYRSSQAILDLAGSLIKHNQSRLTEFIPNLDKHLIAGSEKPIPNKKAEVYEFSTSDVENKFIVEKIKEIKKRGESFSEIAILYRRHQNSEDLIDSLLKASIPIRLVAGRNALNEPVVRQFIDLLKLIQFSNIDIDSILTRVLFYEFIGLNRLDIFKIVNLANRNSLVYTSDKYSIWDIITNQKLLEEAKVEDVERIIEFSNKLIEWKKQSSNLTLIRFIELVGGESGYINQIFNNKIDIEEINSVNSFFQYAKEQNKLNKLISLEEFLADIALLDENRLVISEKEMDVNSDAVNLMTAHKSKGLEYKHVFIIQAFDKNWESAKQPNNLKLPSFAKEVDEKLGEINYEVEDERRLFYVAITRAKERLYITSAKEYPSGNSTKQVAQSIFVNELDPKLVEIKKVEEYESMDIENIKQSISPRMGSPYSVSEAEFLREVIKNFRMSASALNDYLRCPLAFKYERLLKVPMQYNKNLALGTSIHAALEAYFRDLDSEKGVGYLHFVYEKSLEKQLLSRSDFEETLKEGKTILTKYFENYKGKFIKPLEVEYGFYGRDIVLTDEGIDPISLTGKIDKIEPVGSSQSNHVRVVDYKTSTPKTMNDILGKTKNSTGDIYRQLVFYKLLGECDQQFRTKNNLAKYEIDFVEVDFLRPDKNKEEFKKISFEIPTEDVLNLKTQIIDVMQRIRNLEFNGSSEYPLCGECEWCKL